MYESAPLHNLGGLLVVAFEVIGIPELPGTSSGNLALLPEALRALRVCVAIGSLLLSFVSSALSALSFVALNSVGEGGVCTFTTFTYRIRVVVVSPML